MPGMAAKIKKIPAPKFPYDLPYKTLNLREQPHLYRIGRGEEGVLTVQPYKSELLPLWKFKNPEVASKSSNALLAKFQDYKEQDDFVGCDMARKFIQMGVTRARRYANHKGGRKYKISKDGKEKVELPRDEEDETKAESARIFGKVLEIVRADDGYKEMEKRHRMAYDHLEIPKMKEDVVDTKAKQIAEKPKKVSLKELEKRKMAKKGENNETSSGDSNTQFAGRASKRPKVEHHFEEESE